MNELSTERAIEALYTVRAYYASLTAGYPKGKDRRGIGDVMCSEIANSCLMAIKALEQRWIPVSERMPEEPYGCLVTVEDEEPMTGQWFETILPYFVGWDGERWNDADGEQCPFEVIAWIPLPEEPYKAESEE